MIVSFDTIKGKQKAFQKANNKSEKMLDLEGPSALEQACFMLMERISCKVQFSILYS